MLKNASRASDVLSGLFLFLFAIFVGIESYRLGLGTWYNPGAGNFAFGAALVLAIMSLSVIVKGLRKTSKKRIPISSESEHLQWQNVVFVVVAMIVYAFFFYKIGFILSSFLLLGFLLRVFAPQRWFVTILISCFCALGCYILFDVLLGADLPKGILGF